MSSRASPSSGSWLADRARAALEQAASGALRLRADLVTGVEVGRAPALAAAWDALLAFVAATAPPESEVGLSIGPPAGRLHAVGAARIVMRWQVEGARLSGEGAGGALRPLRPGVREAERLARGPGVEALSAAFAAAGWRWAIEPLDSEELLVTIEGDARSSTA